MGATFSRSRTFVAGETLTAVNLNAVETNLLNNFTPAGMDDQSTDVTAMRTTVDPYPSSVASLATALQGELERLRYILVQITGETYWYIDPDVSLATIYSTYPTSATIQSGSVVYVADTGTADVYAATLVPALTAYTTGMEVNVKITNANLTTTPTLNVNALGAKTIKRGNSAALLVGDLPANHQAKFRYNGTDMILLNPALHTHADAGQGGNTLLVPTIADFTNANHTHENAAGGGAVTVADGAITPAKLSVMGAYAVGNYAVCIAPTERTSTGNPTVKVKELKIVGLSGTLRITFCAKNTAASGTARVYKNGSAVGTSQNLTTTYTDYTEDIASWSSGDLIQVYTASLGANTASILSLAVCGTLPLVGGELVGY